MTNAVALVITYGRSSLCELLAMLARQTHPLPTMIWVDDVPQLQFDQLPPLVDVVYGHRFERRDSVGLVRAACVERARTRYALGRGDAILTLDDDDFYAPRHFELTLRALEGAVWTGALEMGLDRNDGNDPMYVCAERGFGQHATWAMRLGTYDAAGGYRDEREEDMSLAWRVGFASVSPHRYLTHVRTHHDCNMSMGAHYDRPFMRVHDKRTMIVAPHWSARCERFARWCAERQR